MLHRKLVKPIVFLLLLALNFSCDFRFTDDHFPVCSSNIAESKERGVYLGYFTFSPNYFESPTGTKYHIEEAFFERNYRRRHGGIIEPYSGEQIVLVLSEALDNKFNLHWELRSERGLHFTQKAPKELHADWRTRESDTIQLVVYEVELRKKTKKIDAPMLIRHWVNKPEENDDNPWKSDIVLER